VEWAQAAAATGACIWSLCKAPFRRVWLVAAEGVKDVLPTGRPADPIADAAALPAAALLLGARRSLEPASAFVSFAVPEDALLAALPEFVSLLWKVLPLSLLAASSGCSEFGSSVVEAVG
jgi:hypothetical protein